MCCADGEWESHLLHLIDACSHQGKLQKNSVRSRPSDAAKGVLKPKVALRYDMDETATYLAHRVPGIFATAFRVLREAGFKLPSYEPESMLDYGSGPGTALLAAKSVWPESLQVRGDRLLCAFC